MRKGREYFCGLAGLVYAPARLRMKSMAAARSLARVCWASSVSLAAWLVR